MAINLPDINAQLAALEARILQAIGTELGTFGNGKPAIWRGHSVPLNLKTTGLRCTIGTVKIGDAIPLFNRQTFADQSWEVKLVNFGNDAKLAIAKAKIEATFVLSRQPVYMPPDDLKLEQCRFMIYAPEVYRVSG
ncbi:hypothetical protein IFO70_10365 [Phormidium tenue FACHB-886]|nr:hypothetical protein [Phormidium tenue FACHB-886]